MSRIQVFDTTLRDGEQSPGATMTPPEKLRVARELERLGVDIVEAGFPAASPHEADSVRTIAGALERPIVAALARTVDHDIEVAAEALDGAPRPRIHTFLATSPIHRERKLGITQAECIDRIRRGVRYARTFTEDVEFSAEDATRTELDFLCRVVDAAIASGASTINIPDTVGYACPGDMARILDALRETVDGIDEVVLSVHCHDDLGLAVANSLRAIEHGARQVECTLNGIGERAGNAALEEIVMALRVIPAFAEYTTGVRTARIGPASRMLSAVTGMRPQPNKAVVGANAFAHEAGIHQDGMIKDASTYEIMTPTMVGARETRLVLGKHSGRRALANRYDELGFDLAPEELDRAYRLFVLLAETKKEIHDEDLLAIYYQGTMADAPRVFHLDDLDVRCGRRPARSRIVVSRPGREPRAAEAEGDGPVDATFGALAELAPWETRLEEFQIEAVSEGKDAVGSVHLQLRVAGRPFIGRAASTDVVEAAARAYLNALDKADHAEKLEARSFERLQYWGV